MKNLDEEYKEYHSGFSSIVKMIIVTVIFTILLLQSCLYTFATTYYFSATGNDGNAGTSPATAWQTISKFNSVFASRAAGDSLLFNRGDAFYGELVISRSGTLASPIIIGAYGTGANPVITGFTSVTSWTNLGGNIWESTGAVSTLSSCNMVVINGVNTAMGRTPNTGYLTYQSFTSTSLTSTSLNAATTNWTGAEVAARRNNWTLDRRVITSASGTTINYASGTYSGINNYGFWIQNDLRTLDTQNEWYYNPSTKKIDIYSTASPTGVQITTVDTLVNLNGHDYISFVNLSFTGSNTCTFAINFSHFPKIQNCNINFSGIDAIKTRGGSCDSTRILNTYINNTNNNAIDLGGSSNNAFLNNDTIKNTGTLPGMGVSDLVAVQLNSASSVIQNCVIDSVGYSGIKYFGNNTIVQNNLVSNFCNIVIDGGGIYTFIGGGTAFTGEKVLNNIVVNGIGSNVGTTQNGQPIVHGIYCDNNTAGVEISGNTSANNSYSGTYLHNTTNCNIHNNTFYNNGYTQALVTSYDAAHLTRTETIKNNYFISKASTQLAASYESQANDIGSFGTIDSNYYARPIDDNLTIQTIVNSSTTTQRTLSGWQSFSAFDAHGNKSAKTISTTSDIRLDYNATSSSVNAGIGWYGETVDGLFYNGIVPLAGFTSVVTMNDGSIIPDTPISNVKIYGRRFKN